jgi:hypothetical protein
MRQDGDTNGNMTDDGTARLTVRDAADALGISTEAARQRIKRGTLPTQRDPDGTVWVLLDAGNIGTNDRTNPDSTRTNDRTNGDGTTDQALMVAHLDSLRGEVDYLREQLDKEREANRENRRLLAAALERIPPQLEPPRDTPRVDETASAEPDREEPRPASDGIQEGSEPRSWWRRWFGFE